MLLLLNLCTLISTPNIPFLLFTLGNYNNLLIQGNNLQNTNYNTSNTIYNTIHE